MSKIFFHHEDISFKPTHKEKLIAWILEVTKKEGVAVHAINFIFCSDEYLLQINQNFLGHDYYTDIITFDNSADPGVESDIFISIDRVRDNAPRHHVTFEDELHRVMIHGVLHLLGYNDKSEPEQIIMRQKENACLSLLNK